MYVKNVLASKKKKKGKKDCLGLFMLAFPRVPPLCLDFCFLKHGAKRGKGQCKSFLAISRWRSTVTGPQGALAQHPVSTLGVCWLWGSPAYFVSFHFLMGI